MEEVNTPYVVPQAAYAPTAVQSARDSALRRFNRLYVYGPIIGSSLIGLVLVGLLLGTAVFNQSSQALTTRQFTSALADIVIILVSLPSMLLCLLFPALIFGTIYYSRQEGYAPLKRLQTILWQAQSLLGKIDDQVEVIMPKVAEPVIQAHSRFAFGRALVQRVRRKLFGDTYDATDKQ